MTNTSLRHPPVADLPIIGLISNPVASKDIRRLVGLARIVELVDSPVIGVNFDTGNSYLCGHDPYAWLEHVADRLVHLHAKDISVKQADAERGKVTGTAVGCA